MRIWNIFKKNRHSQQSKVCKQTPAARNDMPLRIQPDAVLRQMDKKRQTLNDQYFELAYKSGELCDYLCGIGAYDMQAARIGAIINTGAVMGKIYSYYTAEKDDNLPRIFVESLLNLARRKSCFAVYVAMDITAYHLWAETEGHAAFKINCSPILEALRSNIKENMCLYSQQTEIRGFVFQDGISGFISHYDKKFSAYGHRIMDDCVRDRPMHSENSDISKTAVQKHQSLPLKESICNVPLEDGLDPSSQATLPAEYLWYVCEKGKTEDYDKILQILSNCGVRFTGISMCEGHDLGDQDWYTGYFSCIEALLADETHRKYICEWRAEGIYNGVKILVNFKDWNIFGGVHIRYEKKDEPVIAMLLRTFEQAFCSS